MDDSFFRTYVTQPLRPVDRPVPVQQIQRKPSSKAFSVPIRFVSSPQPRSALSETSAALKIQKVFRGFVVRKSVKKIASVNNEVSEIERTMNDAVELIRRDAKERFRLNETLMSLLFRLDSIRGVDGGVRDFRKAVTKRVIAVQEKVDSMVTACYQTLDAANSDSGEIDSENVCKSASERDLEPSLPRDEVVDDSLMQVHGESDVMKEFVKEIDENCNPVEAVDDCDLEEVAETEVKKENCPPNKVEDGTEVRRNEENGGRNDNKRNGELLEKMMIDNEKMMALMTQISESNEMQTRMLNSLSQRVEQLEKAFKGDKRKRKKNRHAA